MPFLAPQTSRELFDRDGLTEVVSAVDHCVESSLKLGVLAESNSRHSCRANGQKGSKLPARFGLQRQNSLGGGIACVFEHHLQPNLLNGPTDGLHAYLVNVEHVIDKANSAVDC